MTMDRVLTFPLWELGGTYGYSIECNGVEVERRAEWDDEQDAYYAGIAAEKRYKRRLGVLLGLDDTPDPNRDNGPHGDDEAA